MKKAKFFIIVQLTALSFYFIFFTEIRYILNEKFDAVSFVLTLRNQNHLSLRNKT